MRRLFRLRRRAKTFGEKQFLARERFRSDYRLIAEFLLRRLSFDSVYDVGCANGFLLSEFQARGKRCAGIELSPAALVAIPEALRPCITIGDFAEARGRWDLVCCVEVAEHLPPERSEELVATVSRLARQWIYFTAAPPGQSGRGHVNCRPHAEWLGWFERHRWVVQSRLTDRLRRELEALEQAVWLRLNSFLLRPAESLPDRERADR